LTSEEGEAKGSQRWKTPLEDKIKLTVKWHAAEKLVDQAAKASVSNMAFFLHCGSYRERGERREKVAFVSHDLLFFLLASSTHVGRMSWVQSCVVNFNFAHLSFREEVRGGVGERRILLNIF